MDLGGPECLLWSTKGDKLPFQPIDANVKDAPLIRVERAFDFRKATAMVMLATRQKISSRAFRWSCGTQLRTSLGAVAALVPLAGRPLPYCEPLVQFSFAGQLSSQRTSD